MNPFEKITLIDEKKRLRKIERKERKVIDKGLKELHAKAKEFQGLLKDQRYPCFKGFIEMLETQLGLHRQRVCANSTDIDEIALVSAKIGFTLNVLKDIAGEVENTIKTVDELMRRD